MEEADIDAIIGNDTWTTIYCHECQHQMPVGVAFGGDEYFSVCIDCLRKGLELCQ